MWAWGTKGCVLKISPEYPFTDLERMDSWVGCTVLWGERVQLRSRTQCLSAREFVDLRLTNSSTPPLYIRENGSKILTTKSYEIYNKKTNIANIVEDKVKQSAMM